MAKHFPSSSQFRVLSLAYFAIGLGLMGLTGCSGSTGPATIKISGKVTYQGQPVSTGTISFQPVSDSKLRPATGQFKDDGSYAVSSFKAGDGAMPGEYKVVIVSLKSGPTLENPNQPEVSAIPARYRIGANLGSDGLGSCAVHGRRPHAELRT